MAYVICIDNGVYPVALEGGEAPPKTYELTREGTARSGPRSTFGHQIATTSRLGDRG